MNIPCEKAFPCVPLFLTLWPLPWSLTHFLKTLSLLITFEQWVLELWYFTWIFPVIRPFLGYHYSLPCDQLKGPALFQGEIITREFNASLGEGDSNLFKWRALLLSRGEDKSERAKIHLRNKKSHSPEPLGQFQPNLAQGILGWRGLTLVQMKNH